MRVSRIGAVAAIAWTLSIVGLAAQDRTRGLVYGDGYAFYVDAPSNWTLDNKAGISDGLHAVFYPDGSSWKAASAVMYANATNVTGTPDVSKFADDEGAQFGRGQPSFKATRAEPITTGDGHRAEVRHLTGDAGGNFEAIAYVGEPNVVLMLVLTARNQAAFDRSQDAFRSFVSSFQFLTVDPQNALDHPELIRQIAIDLTDTPGGGAYDRAYEAYFGKHHAANMAECDEYWISGFKKRGHKIID